MNFYKNLKAKEFAAHYLDNQNAVLIDARSEKEYLESNIEESVNIVYTDKEAFLKLDKGKDYYLHCRVGGRSAVAAFILSQAGHKNIFNLNDTLDNLLSELKEASTF